MRTPLLLLAALLIAGCGSASGAGPRLSVAERDFSISAPARVKPGEVQLAVRNRGPVAHELIVVKVGNSQLPLRRDGLTVDEDAVSGRTVAAIEPQRAGERTVLDVHLTPGRYELFCNMAGHYLGGMHAELVAR
jgi:uncharacterized cupredoxin-like copper-binding protein